MDLLKKSYALLRKYGVEHFIAKGYCKVWFYNK